MNSQNIQKRDTTFKQEHGAVTHAVKRSPHKAVERAIKGAQRLLSEDQGKQALNVLTLAKPVLTSEKAGECADYFIMLATIHRSMGNSAAALRALRQACEHEGLDGARSANLSRLVSEVEAEANGR